MRASELAAELARKAEELGDPLVLCYDASEDLGPVRLRYDVVAGREVLILHAAELPEDDG